MPPPDRRTTRIGRPAIWHLAANLLFWGNWGTELGDGNWGTDGTFTFFLSANRKNMDGCRGTDPARELKEYENMSRLPQICQLTRRRKLPDNE
jgi:hypothetical protein